MFAAFKNVPVVGILLLLLFCYHQQHCHCFVLQIKVSAADGSEISFRKLLLTKCQREFEKDKSVEQWREEMQAAVAAAKTVSYVSVCIHWHVLCHCVEFMLQWGMCWSLNPHSAVDEWHLLCKSAFVIRLLGVF